jgi:hypothetical protein
MITVFLWCFSLLVFAIAGLIIWTAVMANRAANSLGEVFTEARRIRIALGRGEMTIPEASRLLARLER